MIGGGNKVGGNGANAGAVSVMLPEQQAQLKETAVRGAKALVEMKDVDRDAVIGQLPGRVKDIAASIVGGPLDNALLTRNRKTLESLIEQGTNQIAGETTRAGDRVADLKTALTADGGRPTVVRETAKALAEIAIKAGLGVEDFERLVGRLEVLAELQGEKKLGMISNRALKMKVVDLTNGNLAELAAAVGRELAQIAYSPVRQRATIEQIV